MKQSILFLLIPGFLFSVNEWFGPKAHAQNCGGDRYLEAVFPTTNYYQDIPYSKGAKQLFTSTFGLETYTTIDLKMDIRTPMSSDTITKRPCIIWAHSGGFLNAPLLGGTAVIGTKEADDMQAMIDTFASRGYVAASMQYRVGLDVLSEKSALRAVYRASQDASAAVRYFKENAAVYTIDTNYIFYAGSSAGAFNGLHLAYAQWDELPSENFVAQYNIFGGQIADDLGLPHDRPVEHVTNLSPYNSYQVAGDIGHLPKAIVSCWGAIGDTSWIDAPRDFTPALVYHGTGDIIVDHECGEPFSSILNLPDACGGSAMAPKLASEGLENEIHIEPGEEHIYWGGLNGEISGLNPLTAYWPIIIDEIGVFLYNQMKPAAPTVSGPLTSMETLSDSYAANGASTSWYCWDVIGGSITADNGASIAITWDQGIGTASIQLVELSCNGVESEPVLISVTIAELDSDGDGVPDSTDQCSGGDDNLDADADAVPDFCDQCLGNDASGDADADGICDNIDVCLGNDTSGDADADGICDNIDVCLGNDASGDSDADGICDNIDVCLGNDASGDSDADGICDNIDVCLGNDASGDSDADGICDNIDVCLGNDTSGDADADGICDNIDVCLGNDASGDADADGICDNIDVCLGNDASGDADADGICDNIDVCLGNDASGDSDADGICDDNDACPGSDDNLDDDFDGIPNDCDIVEVEIAAFLEGALIPATGLMRTNLMNTALLPTAHPYSAPALSSLPNFPINTVDWIVVEARSGDPSNGILTFQEAQVGLLLSDGSIVHPTGYGPLIYRTLNENLAYYFTVRHRNHLDIVTANPVLANSRLIQYDFRTMPTYGTEQQKQFNDGIVPYFALHAGDYNQDGVIQNTDYDLWKSDPSILNAYHLTDGNLDGSVQTTDFDAWETNKAKLGTGLLN